MTTDAVNAILMNMSTPILSRPIIILLFVVAFVHAAFTGYQLVHKNLCLGPDSFEYLAQAENIRAAGSFYSGDTTKPLDKDLITKRPPLYPLFIAGVKAIVPSNIAIIILQTMIALMTLLATAALMRTVNIVPSGVTALLLPAMLIITPSHFLYANFIMTETILQAIVLLMTFALFTFIIRKKERYLYLYHFLLIAAMLTKPVFYLFAVPSAVYVLWLAYKDKRPRYMISALIPFAVIAGVIGWNYSRTGYAQYSSIQTINILYYNSYYFLVKTRGDAEAKRIITDIETAAANKASYAERTRYIHAECGKIIKNDVVRYAVFHARGVLNFFLDAGRFDLHNFFSLPSDNTGLLYHFSSGGYRGAIAYLLRQPPGLIAALALILAGNLIKLAAVIVFLFIRIRLEFRVFIVGCICYIAFATGPLGATRFAVPVLPLIFICLAGAVTHLRPKEIA